MLDLAAFPLYTCKTEVNVFLTLLEDSSAIFSMILRKSCPVQLIVSGMNTYSGPAKESFMTNHKKKRDAIKHLHQS